MTEQMRQEWEAWRRLVVAFCLVTGKTETDFNAAACTPFVQAVKAWGQAYAKLTDEYPALLNREFGE